jgi:hypothetical protein
MNRRALVCAAAAIAILGAATACKATTTTGSSGNTATSAPSTATGGSKNGAVAKKTMPKFVGMGLQSAQDMAQAAGFYRFRSHDSLGRDRMQILDRDWKVCS